jgi:hypothetical protein
MQRGATLLISTLSVRRWAFDVSSHAAIEQEQEESAERFNSKKLPPPTPDRREGRLFPPEQS